MTQGRRRRGPRGDITREQVLAAAGRVLSSGGLDALSLRAVAAEAGVSPNAIYTYVDDMADLRNALGDAFLARLDLSLLRGAEHPPEALRAFVRHVLDAFGASPGQAELLASQRIAGAGAFQLNEALLDFFVDSVGHSLEGGVGAVRLLTEWLHGRVALTPSNAASQSYTDAMARLGPELERFPYTARMLAGVEADDVALSLLVRAVTAEPALSSGNAVAHPGS